MTTDYTNFKAAFERDLLSFVDQIKVKQTKADQITSSNQLFGLAIMLGEDIAQMDCIAVTLNEAERATISDDYEAQYIADEWPDWHYDAFKATSEAFQKLLSHAPESNPDSFKYTNDEIQFMNGVYDAYLSVLMEHRLTELADIPFVMLYSSDCGRNFMGKSVLKLNTGEVLADALKVYGCEGDSNF